MSIPLHPPVPPLKTLPDFHLDISHVYVPFVSLLLLAKCIVGRKVIEEATPKDVDEFTHAILLISFGKEWVMERWFDENGGGLGVAGSQKAKS